MMTSENEVLIENIPEIALAWHKKGKGAILATVVETWGSAPRRVGGQLVVNKDGKMHGSVSGGCVEAAVVFEAVEALKIGESRLLEYGVSDATAFAVGLACGGKNSDFFRASWNGFTSGSIAGACRLSFEPPFCSLLR